ncbi:putative nuclease HARBI1, partial [Solenopsis invicta]|uniref:putative nuclease HARBI1 n=1 Tax=Solenopsis invicta TaxID=13686 RepID=UPI00193DE685
MIVSDYNGIILTVLASHGGRTHDSRVWNSSRLARYMLNKYQNGRRNVWLLGDARYPLLPYLMTPKLNQPPGSPSAAYKDAHIKARCSIERTIALIVNATCVLHNIAKRFNILDGNVYRDENIEEELGPIFDKNLRARGNKVRERITTI